MTKKGNLIKGCTCNKKIPCAIWKQTRYLQFRQLALNSEAPGECNCRCTRQLALNCEVPGGCNCQYKAQSPVVGALHLVQCLSVDGSNPQDRPVGQMHRFFVDAQRCWGSPYSLEELVRYASSAAMSETFIIGSVHHITMIGVVMYAAIIHSAISVHCWRLYPVSLFLL